MQQRVRIRSISFKNYKALADYKVNLSHLNILVGANNNGKSTVIGAFRVLAEGLKLMRSKVANVINGPKGLRPGWALPPDALPITSENIHTNYDSVDTCVEFRTTNDAVITLFFPKDGGAFIFADHQGHYVRRPTDAKKIGLDVAAVPVLGPLADHEPNVSPETVRKNLLTNRASRNFRNYWLLNPDGFQEFSDHVYRTWQGIEVKFPEQIDDFVAMFCREGKRDVEIYWTGYGFQIWLQLLTHVFRAGDTSVVLIDEPEVYLHPDVQRQLIGILRDLPCDVVLATHSTEIMSEADPSEILLIDKSKKRAERLKNVESVQSALTSVGSLQNITLTRLAQTRRILFTEGPSDMQLLRRFAKVLGFDEIAAGTAFTAIEGGGFSSWERIRALSAAFEDAIGFKLNVAAIFDRDYWCDEQIGEMSDQLRSHLTYFHIHSCKELENYLLDYEAIDAAIKDAADERSKRTGEDATSPPSSRELIREVISPLKSQLQGQFIAKRLDYFRGHKNDQATIAADASSTFEAKWNDDRLLLKIVPGKRVLSSLRTILNERYSVSLTDHRIVSALAKKGIPDEMLRLVQSLEEFRLDQSGDK